MRIVQISDSHIACDRPSRTAELERCIEHINAADPQPDVVVHSGDVAHNGLVEEYAIARQLLDRLTAPYLVLAGNKDSRRELLEVFADVCGPQRHERFVQYADERFDTRLICVDTVSTDSNKGRLCGERLEHVGALLAADRSKPAVLFLHHPPFEVNVGPDAIQFEDWADVESFEAIVREHRQIRGLFCGHVHRQTKGRVGSVPAHVATCIASDLRWDEVTSCIYTHIISSQD